MVFTNGWEDLLGYKDEDLDKYSFTIEIKKNIKMEI